MTARRSARSAMRVLSLVLLGLLTQASKAADGLWDEKFGGDPFVGTQVAQFPGQAQVRAIAETEDGAIWMAGHAIDLDGSTRLALSRMNEHGGIDGTFADGSGTLILPIVSTTFGAATTSAAVDVTAAGRPHPQSVLVAFQYTTLVEAQERGAGDNLLPLTELRRSEVPMVDGAYQTGVALIDASGRLDASFGDNGIAWVPAHAAGVALAREMEVDVQGNVYVLETGVDLRHAHITRFNTQGLVDIAFADLGTMNLTFGTPTQLNSFVLDRDGGLVLAGAADTQGNGNWDALALRVSLDGQLDTAYGNAGRAMLALDLGGDLAEVFNSVALDVQGHLVLAGSARTAAGSTCFATRLDAGGRADLNWPAQGTRTFDIAGVSPCVATSVAVSDAGRLAIGSTASAGPLPVAAVQALDAVTGNADPTFGPDVTGAVLAMDFAVGGRDIAVRFDALGRAQLALTAVHDKPYPQAFAARLTEDGTAVGEITAKRLR